MQGAGQPQAAPWHYAGQILFALNPKAKVTPKLLYCIKIYWTVSGSTGPAGTVHAKIKRTPARELFLYNYLLCSAMVFTTKLNLDLTRLQLVFG